MIVIITAAATLPADVSVWHMRQYDTAEKAAKPLLRLVLASPKNLAITKP
jgi:hypothetical protein